MNFNYSKGGVLRPPILMYIEETFILLILFTFLIKCNSCYLPFAFANLLNLVM